MSVTVNITKRYTASSKGVSKPTSIIVSGASGSTSGATSALHIEKGQLRLNSVDYTHNIAVEFKEPFPEGYRPIGESFLKTYRMDNSMGIWIRQDVLSYYSDDFDWLTNIGFSILIDSSEILDGVVIDYFFM